MWTGAVELRGDLKVVFVGGLGEVGAGLDLERCGSASHGAGRYRKIASAFGL
jgi:hypothetical protein